MFYAHFILKKRGPLSRIWLAAHWDKKLTKAHIFETDIEGSVKDILSPQLKLALRTSSHLLLGVVRIYSRKAKYLLADCNEAFVKIKLAFRPGMVDLPAENREASLTTINIREDFTSFDLDVVDFNEIDFHARFAVNQSRPEDITMREEVACMPFVGDDGFVDNDKLGGPMTIEDAELALKEFSKRNAPHPIDVIDCCEIIDLLLQRADQEHTLLRTPRKMMRNASLADSGFGSPTAWISDVFSSGFDGRSMAYKFQDLDCASSNCPSAVPITATTLVDMTNPTFKDARMLLKTPTKAGSRAILMQGSGDFGFNPGISAIPEVNLDDILFDQNVDRVVIQPTELLREQENRHREDGFDRMQVDVAPEQNESRSLEDDDDDCNYDDGCEDDDSVSSGFGGAIDHKLFSEETVQNQEGQLLYKEPETADPPCAKTSVSANVVEVSDAFCDAPGTDVVPPPKSKAVIQDLTTLLENDAEAFALGPVEVNTKERKTKRKRRLIIDEHKVISSETMKGQLSDSSDLVMSLDLAPPTKKLMLWKETGGVDKLFVLPGKPIVNLKLFKQFSRNLVTTSVSNDNPEISDVAAAAEELRPEDESRIEMMRATTGVAITDVEQEFSQSLFSSDVVDKNLHHELPASPCHDCSVSLPINNNMSNINDDRTALHENNLCPEMNISPCLDRLSLPASDDTMITDNDPVVRQEGSPKRKRHKQSRLSKEPSVKPVESVPQPNVSSDFEEDLENEDAIFDFELAPTCSEKANLRQELEEAELEEKLWNRRSTQMQHILQRKLETSSITSFRELTTRNNRKQAASKFYTILVLTKARTIAVEQQAPFGDILISRGPAFDGIV